MVSYNLGMDTDCCGEGWILVACYRNPRNGFHPVFPSACLGSSFHGLSRFGHRRFGKIVYQGHPRVWSIVCPESFVPFPQQNFWNIKLQLLLNEGRPRNIGNYFYISGRIYLVALFSVKPKNEGPWIASSALPLSPPRFLITLVMPSGASGQFPRNLNLQFGMRQIWPRSQGSLLPVPTEQERVGSGHLSPEQNEFWGRSPLSLNFMSRSFSPFKNDLVPRVNCASRKTYWRRLKNNAHAMLTPQ